MTEPAGRPFVVRWRELLRDSDAHWTAKHVGITMSLSMSSTGKGATMSVETLVDQCSISESSVRRGLRLLEGVWLTCTPGGGRGNTNRYDARKPSPSDPLPTETLPQEKGSEPPERDHTEPLSDEKPCLDAPETLSGDLVNPVPLTPEVVERTRNPEVATTAANGRKRDLLWDAVVDACGYDMSEITEAGKGPLRKAISLLRGVRATPEQVPIRADEYRRRFPHAELTAPALAKHWDRLGTPAPALATVNNAAAVADWLETRGGRS